MAEAKNTPASKTPAKKDAPEAILPETETFGEYTLVHQGHGRYGIEGHTKSFDSRERAIGYIEDLQKVAEFQNSFGDVIPEGVSVTARNLEYRGSLTELPMNELYTPDGAHNPYYDRAWYWAWGRATGNDISRKQARGYRVVSRDELEAAVEEGRVPEHYRSLLMATELGARMQFGDLVLVRIPRVLWRQHRAEQEKEALRRVGRQDEANAAVFDQAGARNTSGPVSNELSSGLKMAGF